MLTGWRPIAMSVLMVAYGAWGGSIATQLQLEGVVNAIERPMPLIEDMPSAMPTEKQSNRFLIVGAFDQSGTSAAGALSQALAFYLSAQLQGQCDLLAVEPAYLLASDMRGEYQEKYPGAREVNERLLARVSPDLLLSGQIAQSLDGLTIGLQVLNKRTGETIALASVNGAMANLDDQLTSAIQPVVAAFCPSVRVVGEPTGSLAMLAEEFSSASSGTNESATTLRSQFEKRAGGSALALRYLAQLWGGSSKNEIVAAAKTALEAYPTSVAVQIFANYLSIMEAPRSADVAALDRLRKVCAAIPNDYSCKLALLDAYRIEQVMYHAPQGDSGTIQVVSGAIDHHEGTARAMSLGIDLVEHHPDNFRAWFHLSMALSKYASLVRGTKYWRDLTEDQRRRYGAIQQQAVAALRKARALHPQLPWIHEEMMGLASASNEGFMDSFRRAVALAPQRRSAYQTAYNYARPQWGGSKAMLSEIYETSKRNNPNADWTENLRKIWAKELSFWRTDNLWAWLVVAALMTTLTIGGWRFRRR